METETGGRRPRGSDDTAVAHEAGSVTDADLVVGLLRSRGIRAMFDSEIDTVFLDGYVGEHRVIQVRVLASDLAAARQIIEDARREPSTEEEE